METKIFYIYLNAISYYVWSIVYWTHYLFPPSLRYRRLVYFRSGHFRLCVFELYILILILILNDEKVTVIFINHLNNYHLIQFSITCIYTMKTPVWHPGCVPSRIVPQSIFGSAAYIELSSYIRYMIVKYH